MSDNTHPITVPACAWEDVSDTGDGTKMLAAIDVMGVKHYIEAYEVKIGEGGYQVPTGPYNDRFGNLRVDFDADDDFETVEIHGRTYCLFMCPAEQS